MISALQLLWIGIVAPTLVHGQQNTITDGNQTTTPNVDQETVYKCESEGVQLHGKLIERMFYGPPGFGETPAQDAREKPLILELERAITVQPAENADAKNDTCLNTFRHVREVQLFFVHSLGTQGSKLLGKSVTATGKLDEAAAPSEHTDVTMEIDSISPR